MSNFNSRDPNAPEFWSERFERRFTPWDRGGTPEALAKFIAASERPYTALIPGCGAGYEVTAMAGAGWDVTAIDFSPEAVKEARAALGALAQRVVQADFFDYTPPKPLDFIYERAFLCALPPARRAEIVARWAELLPPGGLLAGFFYFDTGTKGPPFGIAPAELDALLAPSFERLEDAPVDDSISVFAGKERWQVWQKRA